MRITDACPRVADAVLLATLFRVMVAFAIQAPTPGARYDTTARWLLKENHWQAKRYGVAGRFMTDGQGEVIDAGQWLAQARSRFASTAERMGAAWVLIRLRRCCWLATVPAVSERVMSRQGLSKRTRTDGPSKWSTICCKRVGADADRHSGKKTI